LLNELSTRRTLPFTIYVFSALKLMMTNRKKSFESASFSLFTFGVSVTENSSILFLLIRMSCGASTTEVMSILP
jgi:hypothetical protein